MPPLPLAFEAYAFSRGRDFHAPIFKGEFGFWELGTVFLALTASLLGLLILFGRPRIPSGPLRVAIGILALGCFYLAGEEASWGQHIFGWQAGGVWADVNYQQETNLHNLKVLSLTNQVPRLIITLATIFGFFLVPWLRKRLEPKEAPWRNPWYWVLPTAACAVTALLVLFPPLPRKLGLPSLPEPGETEEYYMALLLALYFASIRIRQRSLPAGDSLEPQAVSSPA
jgi:hypothetical protein